MIAFSTEELEALNEAVYKAWQRAAPKSKKLRTLTRIRNRLKEYTHTGSLFVEPCGCEVPLQNGSIELVRCTLHDAGIDSTKHLATIVDLAESCLNACSDDLQNALDDAQDYLTGLTEHNNRDFRADVAALEKG